MLKDKIIELLQAYLEDGRIFIVDVHVGDAKVRKNIIILVDSDEGIKIEECASISRRLASELEKQELVAEAYNLEVSSPGIDQPLVLILQYHKNICRELKVVLNTKEEIVGILDAVNDESITVTKEIKKKPKKGEEPENPVVVIPFESIEKAKVQISFK